MKYASGNFFDDVGKILPESYRDSLSRKEVSGRR